MVTESTPSESSTITPVSWTFFQHLRQSPAHYKVAVDMPRKVNDAIRWASYVHSLVLEPDLADSQYAFFTGKQRRGAEWDAFKAEAAQQDRTVLMYGTPSARQIVDDLRTLADTVRSHPLVAPLLDGGLLRQTFSCIDAQTGVPLTCRPDIVHPGLMTWADLKTCRSSEAGAFGRSAYNYGYHLQAAFHLRVLRQVLDFPIDHAVLIPAEKVAPFDVGACFVTDDVLAQADAEITRMLVDLKACQEMDVWPGRYATCEPLKLPAYAKQDAGETVSKSKAA